MTFFSNFVALQYLNFAVLNFHPILSLSNFKNDFASLCKVYTLFKNVATRHALALGQDEVTKTASMHECIMYLYRIYSAVNDR